MSIITVLLSRIYEELDSGSVWSKYSSNSSFFISRIMGSGNAMIMRIVIWICISNLSNWKRFGRLNLIRVIGSVSIQQQEKIFAMA